MSALQTSLTGLALLAVAACLPAPSAQAASSTSSAVSDSVGTSSNSLSNSVERSSRSSTRKDVAQGDYKIIDIADAAGQPGMLRLRLQLQAPMQPQMQAQMQEQPQEVAGADAVAEDADTLFLTLPQQAFERSRLGTGQVVAAVLRPYGVEFARADNREAFFLVLADDWQRELQARPVSVTL